MLYFRARCIRLGCFLVFFGKLWNYTSYLLYNNEIYWKIKEFLYIKYINPLYFLCFAKWFCNFVICLLCSLYGVMVYLEPPVPARVVFCPGPQLPLFSTTVTVDPDCETAWLKQNHYILNNFACHHCFV